MIEKETTDGILDLVMDRKVPSYKEWVSVESLKEYVRDLETSNEMYAKDAQELFDNLIEKIEKEIKK